MAVRQKMSREERAKQFMPFAALKGYEDALREKEKIRVEKIILTEERMEELNWKLNQVKQKDMITVIYYDKGEYLKITGVLSMLDQNGRVLKVVNQKIPFDSIYDIQLFNQDLHR